MSNKNFNNGNNKKIIFFFLLISFLPFLISAVFFFYISKQNTYNTFNDIGQNALLIVHSIIEKELYRLNDNNYTNKLNLEKEQQKIFERVNDNFVNNTAIDNISIWSTDFDLIYSSKKQGVEQIKIDLIYRDFSNDPILEIDDNNYFCYRQSISVSGSSKFYGYLILMIEAKDYSKMIISYFSIIYIIIIFLFLSFLLYRRLIKTQFLNPIIELKEGLHRIAEKDFSSNIEADSKNSFVELYTYHNKIIKNLAEDTINNESLKITLSKLQKRYHKIFNVTNIGIFFFEPNGATFEINTIGIKLINFSKNKDLSAANFYSLDFFENTEIADAFENVKLNAVEIENEITINVTKKQKKYFSYKISKVMMRNDKSLIVLSIKDNTEDKRIHKEQEIQQQLVLELLKKDSYKGIAQAISNASTDIFKHDALAFDRYDRRNNYLIGVLSQDTPEEDNILKNYPPIDNRPISDVTYRVLSGEKILINRKETNKRYFASSFGAISRMSKSFMVVPISHRDKILGVISIHSYSDDFFTQEDVDFFANMANLCAEPLLRILKHNKHNVITELIEKLNRPYLNEALGDLIANAVHKLFFYNSFHLFLLDSKSELLKLKFSKEFKDNSFKILDVEDVSQTQSFSEFTSSLPYFDNNKKNLLSKKICGSSDINSEMSVGIYWDKKLESVLLVQSNVRNYFDETDLIELIEFSNSLGGVIAKHIEEQRSISYKKQLKDKVKQRTSLLVDEISNRVTLEDKLKNIFDTSLDAIVTIDHNGIIDIFNISAEKMFKYSKEEVIGKSIQTLIPQKGKIKSIKNLISLI
ncbi:MAG: PAS domain S-box protein, partial [Candidatus Cloacimonadota bacterium]|nr:PAS domain S-box protein [Candidatus Cloacimonadota bacterium]